MAVEYNSLNDIVSLHAVLHINNEIVSEYSIIENVNLSTPPSANDCTTVPFDKDQLLFTYLGEKRKDIVSVTILTIVYVLIFISGVVGNVATCLVIAKNNYMHTVTNYYLFSLAVSDAVTLILGLPPELYCIWEAYPWRFGEPFCIFKSFLSEMTSYCSVLTITAFTAERYIAICYPIKSQTLSNLSRAVKIIVVIWIVAALFALPYPIRTRTFYYLYHDGVHLEESLLCNIPTEWLPEMKYVFQLSTFVFFILPMGIITVMYILIGRSLSKSNFSGNSGQVNANYATKAKARTAVIKMLVAVVVAFFCCWAPFNAQRLMTSYIEQKDWTPLLMDIQGKLFYISGVLYFVGSTVNPILYNLMSKKFRVAFKRTLCRCCYNVEELMELSGRSVLYSDRSTCLYRNQLTTTSVMSRSPLHKSKSGSALITLRDGNTRLIAGKMVMCGNMKPTWSSPVLETKWTGSPKAARWTVSQAPDKRLTRPLKQSLQHTTSEKYLNITSSSLIKVSSTASMVSFEELEQEIYVEVNSLDGQSSTYISDRPSTDSSCKTNTTYL